ncbi:MAG: DUF6414 family protein [Euzebya sp.]
MLYLPKYLDTQLAESILDASGIDLPSSTQVETVTTRARSGSGKLGLPALTAERGGESTSERKESYVRATPPSKLLEGALGELRGIDQLIDLAADPGYTVPRRGIVEVSGDIIASEISDVSELMQSFSTLLASGTLDLGDVPPEFLAMLAGPGASAPILLTMESDRHSFLVKGFSSNLVGDTTVDDLEGDLTMLAYVENVLSGDQAHPLDRYVLPGMSRAMRRKIGREQLLALLDGVLQDGTSVDLDYHGPGIVVRAVSIYP